MSDTNGAPSIMSGWAAAAGDPDRIAAIARDTGIPVAAATLIIDALVEGGAPSIDVDTGGTGAGSHIHPDTAWTTVRNGGDGAGGWLARVTGTHPKFRLAREFLDAHRNLSRSGRSGTVSWDITDPGLYSYGRFCGGRAETGGLFVTDGTEVAEVTAATAARIAGALDLDDCEELELVDLFDD